MTYMHCQVQFSDYAQWKAHLDADAPAQQAAGLFLKQLWRGTENPSTAFFVLRVDDIEKARAFMEPAKIETAKSDAGATAFEWCFVEDIL